MISSHGIAVQCPFELPYEPILYKAVHARVPFLTLEPPAADLKSKSPCYQGAEPANTWLYSTPTSCHFSIDNSYISVILHYLRYISIFVFSSSLNIPTTYLLHTRPKHVKVKLKKIGRELSGGLKAPSWQL